MPLYTRYRMAGEGRERMQEHRPDRMPQATCTSKDRHVFGRLVTSMSSAVRRLRGSKNRTPEHDTIIVCSSCFNDEGLRLDAERIGESNSSPCPRCNSIEGRKLTVDRLITLAQHFFVWGSVRKYPYGAAPIIQFNDRRSTDITIRQSLGADLELFEEALHVGFVLYGPRYWMFGEIEPLKHLQEEKSRHATIDRVLAEYGTTTLTEHDRFYRIRKGPSPPADHTQYDSAPSQYSDGRLDTPEYPALYASPDLQTCLHECRVSAEDDLFVATLRPSRDVKLLNIANYTRRAR